MIKYTNGGTARVLSLPKELKIKTIGENMAKVKNVGIGTLAFKDDKGKRHEIKAGEEIECEYKKSMDSRLVILEEKKLETKKESKKKEEVK